MQRRILLATLALFTLATSALAARLLFAGPRPPAQQRQETSVQFEQSSLIPNQESQQQQQQDQNGIVTPRKQTQQPRVQQQQRPLPKIQARQYQYPQHTPTMQNGSRR